MCNVIANILHACLKGIDVSFWLEIILENSYFHLSKIMDRMGFEPTTFAGITPYAV